MKPFLLLVCLLSAHRPPEKIMLVDTRFAAPITYADQFTTGDLFKKRFPVYASEVSSLVEATQKLAKHIDRDKPCDASDTFRTAHSILVLNTDCQNQKVFTVLLKTQLERTSVSFPLVWKEPNRRKAQARLIDFAYYLAP